MIITLSYPVNHIGPHLPTSWGIDTTTEPTRVCILATENIQLIFVLHHSEANFLSRIVPDIKTSLNSLTAKY